jgi:hypothetical protein
VGATMKAAEVVTIFPLLVSAEDVTVIQIQTGPTFNFCHSELFYPLLYVVHIVWQNRESNLTSLQCRYLIPELTDSLIH